MSNDSDTRESGGTLGLEYADEKLTVAVDCLVGPGDIQDRFMNALISALMRLTEDDLPDDLAPLLRNIEEKTTAFDGPQGSYQASISKMSEDTLRELSEQVVALYGGVSRALGQARERGLPGF